MKSKTMKKQKTIKVLITEIEMRNSFIEKLPKKVVLVFDREQIENLHIEECIDCELEERFGEVPHFYNYEIN